MNFMTGLKKYVFTALVSVLAGGHCIAGEPGKKTGPDFFEAHRAYISGDVQKAKRIFTELVSSNPEDDASYFYLANIALFEQNVTDAALLLDRAIGIDPDNYWYKLRLAQLYLSMNDTDKAIGIYEQIKNAHPDKYDVYMALGDLYMQKNDYGNSMRILDEIETVSGKSEATGVTRLTLYLNSGKYNEAYEYVQQLASEIPTPRVLTFEGDMHAERYADSLAMSCYQRAIELDPEYAPAYYGMAEVGRMRQDYAGFFRNLNMFVKSDKIDPQVKIGYLSTVLQSPNFAGMFRKQLDTVVMNIYSLSPRDSVVSRFSSSYFVQTGRVAKGLEIARNDMEAYPENINNRFYYLSILYFTSDWKALNDAAGEALKADPDNTDFMQLKAVACWRLQDADSAIVMYQAMLPIVKERKDTSSMLAAYASLGDLYMETGDAVKTSRYYEKALRIDPGNYAVLNNYAYFLALENKKLKKAYTMSKATVDAEPDNPVYLDTFAWILHLMGRDIEAKAMLKHAMLYGGNEQADLLDHYAEILYSLGEYDMAYMYWMQADMKDPSMGIKDKLDARKAEMKARQASETGSGKK